MERAVMIISQFKQTKNGVSREYPFADVKKAISDFHKKASARKAR